MLIITSSSPEVPNLLGLDITTLERRARKSWGRNLQDGQGDGEVRGNWLSDTWDGGNQRWQRDLRLWVRDWGSPS
jgi:hypothetical protein